MSLRGTARRIAVALIAGLFTAQPSLLPAQRAISPRLREPAVLVGDGVLEKSVLLERPSLGTVTDLRAEKEQLGIAGTKEAVWTDRAGSVKSSVKFRSPGVHVDFIDVEGDGTFEFLNRGGEGWQPASLLDQYGKVLWTQGSRFNPFAPAVDDMAGGDLDGDGLAEFVVGHNGGGGVRMIDRNGNQVWQQPDANVWRVELVDTDADGKLEIVHSNAGGQITVRDGEGKILSRARPKPYFSSFSICRWPTQKDRAYALLAEEGRIWLFDFDASTAAQFDAPDCASRGMARGTPVRLKIGEPEYLAVLVEFRNWDRSVLYVYDSDKKLVYQEVLDEVCPLIAAVSLGDEKAECLLIGGEGKVWKYTPAE